MIKQRKRTLICECNEISISSEKATLLRGCKCRTSGRKEREFEKVIVEKR